MKMGPKGRTIRRPPDQPGRGAFPTRPVLGKNRSNPSTGRVGSAPLPSIHYRPGIQAEPERPAKFFSFLLDQPDHGLPGRSPRVDECQKPIQIECVLEPRAQHLFAGSQHLCGGMVTCRAPGSGAGTQVLGACTHAPYGRLPPCKIRAS